jgi:serine/threonine protein kinase/Tfp pilus assembly protein PilF
MSTNGSHAALTATDRDEHLDSELARVLESCLARIEAGQPVDVDRLAGEHPGIADQLRSCLGVLRLAGRVEGNVEHDSSCPCDDALEPEMRLGDFRLIHPVGRGGMGIVYEAEQVSLHRRVALKVLPFAATLDPHQLQRFQTEAQAAAQLHHTNIVPVFSVGCERGVYFYAMQFIEGQTLAALIRDLRRLEGLETEAHAMPMTTASLAAEVASGRLAPIAATAPAPNDASVTAPAAPAPVTNSSTRGQAYFRTVANLGVQATEALDYAHRMGIVHRDIKPANLLVDVRGNLWITDFGLARVQADAGLTMTGDVLGTLRYMSPEQAMARRGIVDHRTDIYSLGATLYELLTLRPAFAGQDRQELLRQLTLEEPQTIRRRNPHVPTDLETIVQKAMSKEPEARYATAKELAEDLRRFVELKPIRARRPTLRDRAIKWTRRHTAVVASAVIVLVLAVLGLAISTTLIAAKQAEILRQRNEAQRQGEKARRIVDETYTKLSERWLSEDPGDAELRREFLEKAATYYEEFARAPVTDQATRLEAAYAWLRVGRIGWELRRTSEAEDALKRAIELFTALAADPGGDPLEASDGQVCALIKLGDLLFVAGRHADAERWYRRALELGRRVATHHPGRLTSWVNLGNAQESLGDLLDDETLLDEAESTFRTILSDLIGQRGDVRPMVEQLLKYRRAASTECPSSIASAIEKGADPRQAILPALYRYLGHTLRHLKRYSEAADWVRQALSIQSQERFVRARLLQDLAENLYLDGKYREAFQTFRESLALIPNAPKTLEHFANRMASCPDPQVGDPVEAVRLAKRAVELSPQDRDIWRVLGLAHYRAREWQSAAEAIEMSMKLSVSTAAEWFLMAMAQSRLGNEAQARTCFDKAVTWMEKNSPRDEVLVRYRAEAAELLGVSASSTNRAAIARHKP